MRLARGQNTSNNYTPRPPSPAPPGGAFLLAVVNDNDFAELVAAWAVPLHQCPAPFVPQQSPSLVPLRLPDNVFVFSF